ncbi:MAG: hypothetical protein JSV03_00085 [Planctomycetota bacterium]|nr:MAG: hypothetical protein JSV03_00085 [Planctomycetota bacterium]
MSNKKMYWALVLSFCMAGWVYGGVLENGSFDSPADPPGTDQPTHWDTFTTNDPQGWDGVTAPGGYWGASPNGGMLYGDFINAGSTSQAVIGQTVENIDRPDLQKEIDVSFYYMTVDVGFFGHDYYVRMHITQPSTGVSWSSGKIRDPRPVPWEPAWWQYTAHIPADYGFVCDDIEVEVEIKTAIGYPGVLPWHFVYVDGITVNDECLMPLIAPLDILPDDDPNLFTVNKQSKGRIPMELYGTEELSGGDINLESIMIAGVASPVKSEVDDLNNDGILDVLMHFSRLDLIDALDLSALPAGTVVDVTVKAARASDGYPIEATDSIVLVSRED